jgi:hypothetical protein
VLTSRGIICVLALCTALPLLPSRALAEASWGWAPGVKLGWTFGQGLTWGLEVSFIRLPDLAFDPDQSLVGAALDAFGQLITKTWGIVVNIDSNFRDLFRMRVGAEWVGPGIGLEVGPALVVSKHGTAAGLGITPWIGYHLFGYHTFTWAFSRRVPNMHEIGAYLKAPLLSFGGKSAYSDWDDD